MSAQIMPRGACPTLAAPMQTGDGLLARLNLRHPALTPAQVAGLAQAAAAHGNGLIDVSARGNLQVRGLRAASAPRLAAALTGLGIAMQQGPALQWPVLAGLDPGAHPATLKIVDALQTGFAGLEGRDRLHPKLAIVIDGGGLSNLAGLSADIRAFPADGGWDVAFAADEPIRLPDDEVAPAILAWLVQVAALPGFVRVPCAGRSGEPLHPGVHDLDAGAHIVVAMPPFGQVDAEALRAVAGIARDAGVVDMRPAPGRSLIFTGLGSGQARALADQFAAIGWVTHTGDSRLRLIACVGAPACASAHFDTRALAAELAALMPSSGTVHVSGCAKGCAHPGAAVLTIAGTSSGLSLARDADASAAARSSSLTRAALQAALQDMA